MSQHQACGIILENVSVQWSHISGFESCCPDAKPCQLSLLLLRSLPLPQAAARSQKICRCACQHILNMHMPCASLLGSAWGQQNRKLTAQITMLPSWLRSEVVDSEVPILDLLSRPLQAELQSFSTFAALQKPLNVPMHCLP